MAGGATLGAVALGASLYTETYTASPMVMAALIAISTMAALFPDTDTESKGQNFFYAIMACTDVVLIVNKYYEWAAILGLFAMLPPLGKHRGWTHTWWAMLLVPAPLVALPWVFFRTPLEAVFPYYAAAVIGYFSHLLLDWEF